MKKYGKDVYKTLMKDPVHKWRAKTGIELIHKEPTLEEFLRICKNWILMDDNMKKLSDEKSIDIFGITNEKHIPIILQQFAEQSAINNWTYLFNEMSAVEFH